MNSKKKSSSSPSVVVNLPASVGRVTQAQGKRRNRKRQAATRGLQLVSAPTSLGVTVRTADPQFRSIASSDGRIRVRHRELVADIAGSVAYACKTFSINPGYALTFPWLAGVATSYEAYRFMNLGFEYMPVTGTGTSGAVMMAVDYDASDPAPANKVQFMQTHGSTRVSPWNACVMTCDKADLLKLPQRYTRKAPWTGSGGDIKMYDVGNLHVATEGFTGTSNVGEIYVVYDVELITPQPVIYAPEVFSVDLAGTGTLTQALPLGAASIPSANPTASYDSTNGVISFKRLGQYLLQVAANAVGATGFNFSPSSAIGLLTQLSTATASGNYVAQVYDIEVTSLPASIKPAITSATAAPTSMNLRMAPFLAGGSVSTGLAAVHPLNVAGTTVPPGVPSLSLLSSCEEKAPPPK